MSALCQFLSICLTLGMLRMKGFAGLHCPMKCDRKIERERDMEKDAEGFVAAIT